jgi:hypothetical protein
VCLGFSIGLVNLPLPFCPPQTRDGLDCVNINDSTTQSNRVHSSGRRRTQPEKETEKKRNSGEVKNFPPLVWVRKRVNLLLNGGQADIFFGSHLIAKGLASSRSGSNRRVQCLRISNRHCQHLSSFFLGFANREETRTLLRTTISPASGNLSFGSVDVVDLARFV